MGMIRVELAARFLFGDDAHDRPGHSYVDLTAPVDTLVLSRDEYAG